jgi:hypothetical protein
LAGNHGAEEVKWTGYPSPITMSSMLVVTIDEQMILSVDVIEVVVLDIWV